jgi:hypothetical protein
MTDWWTQPYPGAPMVAVAGFPRPLYPPDANQHGKQPSMDGPDVEAYKRTVSRAGRWPWQPFDEVYSNGFAHGRSGNVIDTGVAGVQRQQDIDDTGWLGKTTFNTLRSIVIPAGLPHAGESAMDAFAAELVNEAFDIFGGHEPDSSSGTVRQAALALAKTQIGVKESPPNSNHVKYCDWYGVTGPWCAMFATWCFETNERGGSPTFAKGSRYAYVPYIVADARAGRYGLHTVGADAVIPGDLACYDWDWNGEYDHVGIFERWTGSSFDVLEGNTSPANDSNGGEVMRRNRNTSSQATTFVRVTEP